MEEVVLEGARGILINITGGPDITLYEINQAIEEQVNTKCDPEANIIFGTVIDENMADEMKVTILATGFTRAASLPKQEQQEKEMQPLKVSIKDYNNTDFEDPPYLLKKKKEQIALKEAQEIQSISQRQQEAKLSSEPPLTKSAREEILPSIFGSYK